jgi:hypothetical protein
MIEEEREKNSMNEGTGRENKLQKENTLIYMSRISYNLSTVYILILSSS